MSLRVGAIVLTSVGLCNLVLVGDGVSREMDAWVVSVEPGFISRHGDVEVRVFRPLGKPGQLVAVASDERVPFIFVAPDNGNELTLMTMAGTVRIQRAPNGFSLTVRKNDGTEIRSVAVRDGKTFRISGGDALDGALQEVLAPATTLIGQLSAAPGNPRSPLLPGPNSFLVGAQEITACELTAIVTTTLESAAMAAAFPTMGGSLLAGALTSAFFGILWAAVC